MARKSEADLIREAVTEHSKRPKLKGRRASKVNSFKYKETETAKRKRADRFHAEQERLFGLRVPGGPTEFEEFEAALSPDAKVFAVTYFRMECGHASARVVAHRVSLTDTEAAMLVCDRCGSAVLWLGSKTATTMREWMDYCPDGFDMFDWQDLFVKDRRMWRFIHDEVLADMIDDTMKEED